MSNAPHTTANGNPRGTSSDGQQRAIWALVKQRGWDEDTANQMCKLANTNTRISGLSVDQATAWIDQLKAELRNRPDPDATAALDAELAGGQAALMDVQPERMQPAAARGNH